MAMPKTRDKRRVFSDPTSTINARPTIDLLNVSKTKDTSFLKLTPSIYERKKHKPLPSKPQSRRKLRYIRQWNKEVAEVYRMPHIPENLYCSTKQGTENVLPMPIPQTSLPSWPDKIRKALNFRRRSVGGDSPTNGKSDAINETTSNEVSSADLFGMPLSLALEKYGKSSWTVGKGATFTVPMAFKQWAEQIINRGLDVEGIFRKTSDQSRMRELAKNPTDPDIIEIEYVHNIAGLLKKFLRDLPEPLLTPDLCDHFHALITSSIPKPEKVIMVTHLLRILPQVNLHLLCALCAFLSSYVLDERHASSNLQTAESCAIIFGSACVLWYPDDRNPSILPSFDAHRKPLSPLNGPPAKLAIQKRRMRRATLVDVKASAYDINSVVMRAKRGQIVFEYLLFKWQEGIWEGIKPSVRPGAEERDDWNSTMPTMMPAMMPEGIGIAL